MISNLVASSNPYAFKLVQRFTLLRRGNPCVDTWGGSAVLLAPLTSCLTSSDLGECTPKAFNGQNLVYHY
jgi:hypothetical protein